MAIHLTFFLGDEEYGVPLGRVKEIAPAEGVTRVPGAPDLLRGVVDVRGVPVAVVDLCRKFGLPARAMPARASLLVVGTEVAGEDNTMAVVVDRISRVLEIEPRDVEPVPPLSSGIRIEFLRGMVRNDRGFVHLLDLDLVLAATEQEALTGCIASLAAQPGAVVAAASEVEAALGPATPDGRTRRLVVVSAAGVRCGVDAARVREVTPSGGVTRVPGAPSWFHGLHNLRGAMLPVLDLAAAMGKAPFAPRGQSAFLVLDTPGEAGSGSAGLAVEAVLGMVEVGIEEIETLPAFASSAPAPLVAGTVLSSVTPSLVVAVDELLGAAGPGARPS